MKFKINEQLNHNPQAILRNCGYFPILDRKTQKSSFIKKITRDRYPRFHLYLRENNSEIIFDLHLDQRKTVYSNQKAHNADYDSPKVKQELTQIFQEVRKSFPTEEKIKNPNKGKQKTDADWFSRFLNIFKK